MASTVRYDRRKPLKVEFAINFTPCCAGDRRGVADTFRRNQCRLGTLPTADGEEAPFTRHALELVSAAVFELKSPTR
jgi:hypothetical protein